MKKAILKRAKEMLAEKEAEYSQNFIAKAFQMGLEQTPERVKQTEAAVHNMTELVKTIDWLKEFIKNEGAIVIEL